MLKERKYHLMMKKMMRMMMKMKTMKTMKTMRKMKKELAKKKKLFLKE